MVWSPRMAPEVTLHLCPCCAKDTLGRWARVFGWAVPVCPCQPSSALLGARCGRKSEPLRRGDSERERGLRRRGQGRGWEGLRRGLPPLLTLSDAVPSGSDRGCLWHHLHPGSWAVWDVVEEAETLLPLSGVVWSGGLPLSGVGRLWTGRV